MAQLRLIPLDVIPPWLSAREIATLASTTRVWADLHAALLSNVRMRVDRANDYDSENWAEDNSWKPRRRHSSRRWSPRTLQHRRYTEDLKYLDRLERRDYAFSSPGADVDCVAALRRVISCTKPGDHIVLAPGTYRVSDCIEIGDDCSSAMERLTIRGGGGDRDKVVLVGQSQDDVDAVFNLYEAEGVTLSCLTIVNERRSDEAVTVCCFSGHEILFENCVVLKHGAGSAINFSTGTVARVANCDVGMLVCGGEETRYSPHIVVERSTLVGAFVLGQASLTLRACQVGDGLEYRCDSPTSLRVQGRGARADVEGCKIPTIECVAGGSIRASRCRVAGSVSLCTSRGAEATGAFHDCRLRGGIDLTGGATAATNLSITSSRATLDGPRAPVTLREDAFDWHDRDEELQELERWQGV